MNAESIADDVALAITGASGGLYAWRLLQALLAARQRVHLMISAPGRLVLQTELGLELPGPGRDLQRFLCQRLGVSSERLAVYGKEQWMAPLASGSNAPKAMVVCPCTTASLSAIASGASRSLIERAADVVMKESRRLILVVRETPFSAIHLENMLKLARLGVVILPANPGFYAKPESIEDLVDFVVARVMDQLGLPFEGARRWGE